MSWQNVVALSIFVGVCGFIAYAGDLLGRRMGKRRLSLFGMRPRYTAIVTTTVTGMLIAAFTIAIMAAASEQVRVLVTRGAKIAQDYQAARREVERQRGVASRAREQAREAVQQRDALAGDIERLTNELLRLREDLRRNKAALASTEKQLASAQSSLASASREIAARRREIAEQKLEIERLEEQRAAVARLYAEEMGLATVKYIALREKPIVFRSKQEIARRVIRCTQSKLDIRAEVLALLGDADRCARAEGAKVGENGRAVGILPVSVPDPSGKPRFLKESATIDAIVDNISGGSGSVVVCVVSVGNSVEGEQALVDLRPYYNRLVYTIGQEVASTVIDGAAPRGQILEDLVVFLRSGVRPAAIHRGIIPSYDEEGQPSIGEIPWGQLFEVIDRVKAAGKRVRVRAEAADDTWAAGPLALDLIVSDSQ